MTKANKLLEKAIKLSAEPNDTFLELSRCLAAVYDNDKSSLGRFVARSGLGKRKAYYLLELGQRIRDLKLPEARLKRIGWTKLQVISKHLTQDNADEMLQLAENNNTPKLTALTRGEKAEATHCVKLYFTPAQYSQLRTAILRNGGVESGRGLANMESAIMKLVRQAIRSQRTTPTGRLPSTKLSRELLSDRSPATTRSRSTKAT